MSTNIGTGECCLSGHIANDTSTGREETIAGYATYVAEPKDDCKAKSIVIISDIFGWKIPNIRIVADIYAKEGFYVYVPDFHDGNSIPYEMLQVLEPPLKNRPGMGIIEKTTNSARTAATLGPWMISHREAVVKPKIDSFINHLKTVPGTNKIGALGFCWGGRYAMLAAHGQVDAAAAFHPSMVGIPADVDGINKPITIGVGDHDGLVDEKTRGQIQDLLAKKTDVPHEFRIYEDQIHGFSVRGDWSSDKDKKAMNDAAQQAIDWFNRYLS